MNMIEMLAGQVVVVLVLVSLAIALGWVWLARRYSKTVSAEPRVVSAVLSASAPTPGRYREFPSLSKEIEQAMARAIEQALADGVSLSDSEELIRRKMDARLKVLARAWGESHFRKDQRPS